MSENVKTICRICGAYCPIELEIQDGRPVRVIGDRSYPLYGGYTCAKGRALPKYYLDPNRLLFSMKKGADGEHYRIGTNEAITEIADRLSELVERYGPRSVALYLGQPMAYHPALAPVALAFMSALGSPMVFSTATIDQPGLNVADALHGRWEGGRTSSADADVFLLVGANPVISKQYLAQNPAAKLKSGVDGGAKLIVIDPRASETTRRAHVHLQTCPGEDAAVLAGLLHILIAEDAIDHEFVRQNVQGLESLSEAVRRFTPDYVARRARIEAGKLREAASLLAAARKAFVGGGTGIGMTGHGNLCFYLLLCIQSMRGFWARAGDGFTDPRVLRRRIDAKAQPTGPYPANLDLKTRVRGLQMCVAGMPTGALMEEILTPGDGQVRAFICLANPMLTMPDTDQTVRALASLELLVTPNIEMSATARMSHYVIATKHMLETPAATHFIEAAKSIHYGYGWEVPHAQYTPALFDPPANSDVIDDAHVFYRLAQRMALKLSISAEAGLSVGNEGELGAGDIDMESEPTTDELFDLCCRGSVVPLSEVRNHPGPRVYEGARQIVLPRDPGCDQKLDVGNDTMLAELLVIAEQEETESDRQYPFRLIPRRANDVINSSLRLTLGIRKMTHNPAFLHPSDMVAMGIEPGTLIEIRSRHGGVTAIAAADVALKPGVLSITHGFGATPGEADDPMIVGTNVNRLLRIDEDYDSITGSPRMGAVPVRVSPVSKPA